jgi:hypothetical protein
MLRLEKRPAVGNIAFMGQPIDVDLPHKLGKDAAKRRIGDNVHKLHEHLPGGGKVTSHWEGDTLNMSVAAMGEAIQAKLTVYDDKVHCHFDLPGLLGMFAQPIAAMLKAKGADILLEDHRP